MKNGYDFYFADGSDVLTFPITPSQLTITVGSKNTTVTLINEGDINILKSPALTEVEFKARFPMRRYPYAKVYHHFEYYFDKFKELKEKKKSFRFIVTRTTPNDKRTWDTNILVALESMDIEESADEGDDVIISFKLKQYKNYGVKILNSSANTTSTSTTTRSADNETTTPENYTVQYGDCLWIIAKRVYGDGSLYTKIWETNEALIKQEASKRGHTATANDPVIFEGTVLVIPSIS